MYLGPLVASISGQRKRLFTEVLVPILLSLCELWQVLVSLNQFPHLKTEMVVPSLLHNGVGS